MDSSFNIQRNENVTYVTLQGTINIEFIKTVTEEVWQGKDYTNPCALWDFRSCIMGIGPQDLQELVHLAAGDRGDRGNGKVAIVVEKDLHFKLAQIYESHTVTLPFEIKAFQEIESARDWLSGK